MTTRTTAIYLEFLAMAEQDGNASLDPLEERMLNCLASHWHRGDSVNVVQAMHFNHGASSTTAHRRIKSLRSKGMITLDMDEKDNRVKYIRPSTAALDYFERRGALMLKAVKHEAQTSSVDLRPSKH